MDTHRAPSRIKLLVVTVNYRAADQIVERLGNVTQQLRALGDAALWIVDNKSPDDSLRVLTEAIAARGAADVVRVIASPENGGFGAGNNVAFREALALPDRPDYLYLLNPDAAPDPGAIERLVQFMDSHPQVGIAGGAIRDPDSVLQASTFRFPSMFSEIETSLQFGPVTRLLESRRVSMPTPREATFVDWVSGASMILRREVLERAGLFDEGFFLYWEEVDLCRRARAAGFEISYVPDAAIVHVAGGTTGFHQPRSRVPRYWFESRAHFYRKTLGPWKLLALNLVAASCVTLRRIREAVTGRAMERPHYLRDFIEFNFFGRRAGRDPL